MSRRMMAIYQVSCKDGLTSWVVGSFDTASKAQEHVAKLLESDKEYDMFGYYTYTITAVLK